MPIKITNTDILKNKALMVRLTRKKFNRNKTDKDISVEVSDKKKVTEPGALRVNKSIFSKDVTKGYQDVYSQAGKYFYRVTLPWDDKGWRLLSIDLYKEFTKMFKGFSNDYRKHVGKFVDSIESHVEASKEMLGDAWKAEDYNFIAPNGSVDRPGLEDQFHLEIEFDTVTSGEDLRASLTEADREVIAAQIDKQAMEKFQKANEHIVVTLRDAVYSIHERLCESEHVFRDTLISNLEELVDLIPKMNIAGDPRINTIAEEAKEKLTGWDPQDLRDDPDLRKKVDKDAKKILGNLDGII